MKLKFAGPFAQTQNARRLKILGAALLLLFNWGCRSKNVEAAFDVPSLVGKTMDQVQAALGAPVAETAGSGADFGRKTWRKNNQVLNIEYKKSNGRVMNFALSSEDEPRAVREEGKDRFLQIGKLKEADPRYMIEYVESPEKVAYFSGAKITPAPVNHAVTFNIIGQSGVINVSYTLRPENGEMKSQALSTVAPWHLDETASTGAYLMLKATREEAQINAVLDIKLQLLIDGKVARELAIPNNLGQTTVEFEIPN